MTDPSPLILIVDDNAENLQFLGSLLMENGYDVGVAMNGTQALTFCNETCPDLILLDVMMPGMDGYECCARLKKDLATRHIPVIFLTAKTETKAIVRGFDTGGADYVSKPFIPAELMARIKIHMEVKHLRHLLPICSVCKKVRDDKGYWNDLDIYLQTHTDTAFSHGMCKDCGEQLYGDQAWYIEMKKNGKL